MFSTSSEESDKKIDIVRSFNSTLKEFMDDMSLTFPEYKNVIRATYHQIEEDDTRFLQWFDRESKNYFLDITTKNETLFTEQHSDLFLLPEINFCFVFRSKISEHTREAIWKYLHTLLLLVSHYQMNSSDIGSTFEEWSKLLDTDNVDPENLQDMQEQAQKMLKLMETITSELGSEENEEEGSDKSENDEEGTEKRENGDAEESKDFEDDPFIKQITKGKIAKLAEELAHEIKMEELGLTDQTSMNDVFKLLGKNPQKIMELVKTVGGKIQSKLEQGDLKESELMTEAQNIMSNIPNSKMFKKMFKKAKNGGMPDPATLFKQFSKMGGMGSMGGLGKAASAFAKQSESTGDEEVDNMFNDDDNVNNYADIIKTCSNLMGGGKPGKMMSDLSRNQSQERLRKKMEKKRKTEEPVAVGQSFAPIQSIENYVNDDELIKELELIGNKKSVSSSSEGKKKKKKKAVNSGDL